MSCEHIWTIVSNSDPDQLVEYWRCKKCNQITGMVNSHINGLDD